MIQPRPPSAGAGARRNTPQQRDEYQAAVLGSPAFAHLEVELRPGQTIVSNGGALAYMREGVRRGELKLGGGALDFLKRAVAGQSMLQTTYTGLASGRRLVTFASPVPGDILRLELAPGQSAVVSRESYLAGSPTVAVGGKLNWRGVFGVGQDEGIVLPKLTCTPIEKRGGDPAPAVGTAWLGSYGAFQRHELQPGESLLVDNGLFLACVRPAGDTGDRPLYTVVKLGQSIMSSLLGGEGLGMRFDGPATVYTQSHNLNDLAAMVAARLPDEKRGGGPAFEVGGGARRAAAAKKPERKAAAQRMKRNG